MADGVDTGTGAMVNMLANPPNPFERAGQGIAGISALKDFQARQATAGLYGQAIDPTTGQFDTGRFNALLQSNPAALWNAGAAMQQAGAAQAQQAAGTSADVAAKMQQLNVAQAYLMPLYQRTLGPNPQPVTGAMVTDALKNVPPGVLTPAVLAQINKHVADIGPDGDASGMVQGGYYATEAGRQMLAAQNPGYGSIQAGGTTYTYQTNPQAKGGTTVPAAVTMTPSPGEQIGQAQWLNAPVKDGWLDPDTHERRQGTLREWYVDNHVNPDTVLPFGNLRPGPDGTVVVPGGSAGPVRVIAPTAAPAAAGAPGAAPAAPSGYLPPGRTAAAPGAAAPAPVSDGRGSVVPPESTVAAGEAAYNTMRADMPNSQQRLFAMNNALSALRNAKTGPGTEWLQTINGLVGSWYGGVPASSAANYDEANKYLQTVANTAVGSLGGQATNDKLAAAVTANPSVHVQQLAADNVLKVMIAGEKMRQYVWQQAQAQNVPPADFADYSANWATTHDPRAFILDQLPASRLKQLQAETIVNGKLTPDGVKLANTIAELRNNKQIPDPTRPPGG